MMVWIAGCQPRWAWVPSRPSWPGPAASMKDSPSWSHHLGLGDFTSHRDASFAQSKCIGCGQDRAVGLQCQGAGEWLGGLAGRAPSSFSPVPSFRCAHLLCTGDRAADFDVQTCVLCGSLFTFELCMSGVLKQPIRFQQTRGAGTLPGPCSAVTCVVPHLQWCFLSYLSFLVFYV